MEEDTYTCEDCQDKGFIHVDGMKHPCRCDASIDWQDHVFHQYEEYDRR
jgi:hypothetical protein